ncbi:hypothetical protein JAAARDRAFT_123149 [Jaapia argillacea MUCL 33604]|uniref:Uncharacterized protein n=1 Tax=Jaapia argillacea MUCL 33604 TaxID=933084 RepID=A0A067Q3L3_9AGAM|nr:hypothetical protein JAAARDRAFT_123149 [Jaapia argillacea MUCL 33604]
MDLPQSNDRQPTSKSRGICRYYSTSRGCFAGDKCKFLHGEQEKITPFDRSKTCIYYAQGYCRRGSQCWFKHVAPSTPQPASSSDDLCSICFEKPITYGLLVGCSHVFCINCIREWRAPANKSTEVVSSGVIKKCPYCRVEARFITPSSVFYPEGHAGKHMTIERYKSSMARVPCRYFQQSRRDKRFCPFGKDCFYQHTNDDGTPFVFEQGVEESMRVCPR